MSAGLSGMKKDLHPTTGPISMVPLGQKSENFCGATQIDENRPLGDVLSHIFPW